jgi:hypothetical protein
MTVETRTEKALFRRGVALEVLLDELTQLCSPDWQLDETADGE